jgi:hypothetical protein
MVRQRRYSRDQRSPRIAAKRVLQQARQFRVTVRHEFLGVLVLCKRLDNLAQARQRQINRLKLKHVLLRHSLVLVDFLTACQIAQVQLRFEDHAARVRLRRLNLQLEDGVRARGVHVRMGLASDARLLAPLQKFEAVLHVGHYVLGLAFDEDAVVLVLADHERLVRLAILQQVKQLLVVNLQERTIYHEGRFVVHRQVLALILKIALLLQLDEELVDGSGDQAELLLVLEEEVQVDHRVLTTAGLVVPVRPKHRECLARARLTVREYRCVESIAHIDDRVLHEMVDFTLLGAGREHFVVLGFHHRVPIS